MIATDVIPSGLSEILHDSLQLARLPSARALTEIDALNAIGMSLTTIIIDTRVRWLNQVHQNCSIHRGTAVMFGELGECLLGVVTSAS
jgi:hypothetical protein